MDRSGLSRRALLRIGGLGIVGLAGCMSGDQGDERTERPTTASPTETSTPTRTTTATPTATETESTTTDDRTETRRRTDEPDGSTDSPESQDTRETREERDTEDDREEADESDTAGNGRAIFIFDDGHESALKRAEPVLSEYGFPGTVAVITDRPTETGEHSSYLSLPELRELQRAGWEVCSHTASHDKLTEIPFSEVDDELRESRAWLDEHGFETEALVYPKGGGSNRIDPVAEKYYGVGYGGGGAEPPAFEERIRIGRYPSHEPDEVIDAIERASSENRTVPVMLHAIVDNSPVDNETTVEELARICEAVDEAGLAVLTGSEYGRWLPAHR